MSNRLLAVVVVILPALALAACEGAACRRACTKLAKCMGIDPEAGIGYASSSSSTTATDASTKKPAFTCQLSAECSPKESCLADCMEAASCEALTGKDSAGASALAACQLECANKKYDRGVARDGLLRFDGGGCVPSCSGKSCGDDGCGGSCGLCVWPETCGASGQCECKPRCTGKHCGSDGCGGSCGSCGSGTTCNSSGLCVSSCTPSCSGKQCGSDGCGGSCGSCGSGATCQSSTGLCVSSCTPSCSGKQCGSNGCGGSCGTCPSGSSCDAYGTCQTPVSGCGSVSYEGCCSGSTLKYCSSGQLVTQSCASNPSCGWSSSGAVYDCGTVGGSDPSGLHPRTCP